MHPGGTPAYAMPRHNSLLISASKCCILFRIQCTNLQKQEGGILNGPIVFVFLDDKQEIHARKL